MKANPGQAQVQKSSIMKVKHENVITNENLNTDSGIGEVRIDGMPAGNYSVTATKIGGGQTITEYTSTTTIDVTNGNTSGVPETLRLSVTGTTIDGTNIYWPQDSGHRKTYRELTVPKDATKADIISLVKSELNGKTISLADSSGGNATAFEVVEVDDNGKITATSTEGQLTEIQFLPQSKANIYPGGSAYSYLPTSNPDTDTKYVAELAARITLKDSHTETASDSSITFTVTDNGTKLGTKTVNIPAGTSVAGITEILNGIRETYLKANNSDSGTYSLSSPESIYSDIKITASLSEGSDIDLGLADSGQAPERLRYTIDHTGTTKFVSESPREAGEEKYTLRIAGATSGSEDLGEITFDSNVKTAKDIAQKVAELVEKKRSVVLNGVKVFLKVQQTESSYTITTSNANQDVHLYFYNYKGPEATTKVPNASFTVTDDGGKPIPGSVASLTGFYGDSSTAKTLSDNITSYVDCSKAENNASILFTVTSIHTDETTGKHTVSLSAASSVLTPDGNNASYTKNISLSDDFNSAEIGSLLGEDNSHLTLSLPGLDKFNAGDKFVLSVSGSGKESNAADTSLYINGTQDSSWPYGWSGDYLTYNNNDLYYNVNAQAVSNRDINIRNFYLNSDNGKVHQGDISLTLGSDFANKAQNFPDAPAEGKTRADTGETNIAQFTANHISKIAGGNTKLRDIEAFWNKSGVFMLEQPQTITISQNDGRKAQITLNAADTLNDVRQKLNDAISEGLGQGLYVKDGDANNIVTFVETPDDGAGLETVKGTFMIRSLIPGSAGELTFSSNNGGLIDALGLNTVINSQEGSYTVSVFNAHDNSIIARDVKTSGNLLEGVIDKNIDIEFDPMSGVNASWSNADKNFVLIPQNESYTATIHVVKNNITFQTGANEGQEITLDIGNMSSGSLGVSGVNVMTHKRAANAITTIDAALRRVSSQRSKLGTYQNALEKTLETLTVSNEGMTAADSRIRDADISKSMMKFVKFQIINQAGTSMLAQANQLPSSVMNLIQQ